mmetsp:Transcript_16697/g.42634  ORF Transcript_16697/g.42634 Transcript_16697/m.42634 type:complete len:250 (-) Transcript_16697:971-1720(-)
MDQLPVGEVFGSVGDAGGRGDMGAARRHGGGRVARSKCGRFVLAVHADDKGVLGDAAAAHCGVVARHLPGGRLDLQPVRQPHAATDGCPLALGAAASARGARMARQNQRSRAPRCRLRRQADASHSGGCAGRGCELGGAARAHGQHRGQHALQAQRHQAHQHEQRERQRARPPRGARRGGGSGADAQSQSRGHSVCAGHVRADQLAGVRARAAGHAARLCARGVGAAARGRRDGRKDGATVRPDTAARV